MKRERETRPAKTIRYRPRDPTKASSHAPQTTAPLHTGLANSTPLSQNTTTTTTIQPSSEPKQLRGYYFRKDVNRYFKIPKAGEQGYREYKLWLEEQEKEKAKKAEVPKKILPAPSRVNHLYQPTSRLSTFPRALRNREREPNGSWQRLMNQKLLSRSCLVTELHVSADDCIDIQVDPVYRNFILTGSTNGHVNLFSLDLDNDSKKIHSFQHATNHTQTSISSTQWNPKDRDPKISCVICSARLMRNRVSTITGTLAFFSMDLQTLSTRVIPHTIWIHKWSPKGDHIALGTSAGLWTLDVESNKLLPSKAKIDVFSIDYLDDNTCFFGTRTGKLTRIDKRGSKSQFTAIPHGSSPITHISVSKVDPNYLLSSLSNGTVCSRPISQSNLQITKWDIRMNKDDKEELLAIGGQDKKIHIYDIKKGQKLREIDPQGNCQANALVFSEEWYQLPTANEVTPKRRKIGSEGIWTVVNNKLQFWSTEG